MDENHKNAQDSIRWMIKDLDEDIARHKRMLEHHQRALQKAIEKKRALEVIALELAFKE